MSRSLTSFITLFLLLISISSSAQSVGVVLSGGGAKGLYHIGVLQALEENGIPIDYVAGTSMGSIVAGLYAAGYSPEQMREIVTSGEIEDWLSGRIDSSYGAYYRHYREMPSLFSLRLDTKTLKTIGEEVSSNADSGAVEVAEGDLETKEKVRSNIDTGSRASLYMPNSLISSTQVDMTLTRLFSGASASVQGKFDNLMVPFLCVASDMRNHQAVVLTSGDLGESIRASMAIPVAFDPIKRDTMLLYDGGIYDNFPWEPLVERHSPDIIIGSICTAGNTILEKNSNLVDQIFAISTQKSKYELPEGNITIRRDVNVGMLDFANGGWIIDQGYHDTMAKMDSIKITITSRRDSTYYTQRREKFLEGVKPLVFEAYEINGLTTEQNLYVHDFLRTSSRRKNILQREMPFEELQENLYRILSSGDFSTEYPVVKYDKYSENYKFFINLKTKPQTKLTMGGHLSSTVFNQLLLSLNHQEVNRVAQSYYADLYLGTINTSLKLGGRTDFYIKQPLFIDYYFSSAVSNMEYSSLGNITSVDNTESVKTNDSHFSAAVGIPLSRRSLLTARINSGWSNYYYDIPDEALSTAEYDTDESTLFDRTRLSFTAAKLEYQRNTLNRVAYPQSGSKISLSAIAVMGQERNYQTYFHTTLTSDPEPQRWLGGRVEYEKYFEPPFESWFSLGIKVDAVYTNINRFGNPTAAMLTMPAYQPVNHSKMIFMPNYSATAYAGIGIMPIFNLGQNMLCQTGFYTMLRENYSIEGITDGVIDSDNIHHICEATAVYHSSIGALSISLIKYDIKDWNNLYLTFGFGIPIFAPKGIYY